MLRPGKARRPRVCAQARHRDADLYQRYAVGLYRQALFGALPQVVTARRVLGLRPRDMAPVVRAALRRLTTAPAAVEDHNRTSQRAGKSDAKTRLRHSSHHGGRGNHARPDGGHVIAGHAALHGDEEDVTAALYPWLMLRCAAARYSAGSDRAVPWGDAGVTGLACDGCGHIDRLVT